MNRGRRTELESETMKSELADEPTGPLRGVRVVDHTSVIFGPYGTQILGDLGADVIKVEPKGNDSVAEGDPIRRNGPRARNTDDLGPLFISVNRNKRAVALDLRDATDQRAMTELIRSADVFVSNCRQSGLDRLCLNYETLRQINPDIIYVHATGYGSGGRYAGRAAYDDVIQAAAGVSYLLSHKNEGAPPRYVPSVLADKISGMFLAQAVTAALYNRAAHGQGQFVEVPMFECMVSFNMIEHIHGRVSEPPIGEAGYPRMFESWNRPLRTADGHIAILIYNLAQWRRLIAVLGLDPSTINDPRYFGPQGPIPAALIPLIEAEMQQHPTAEWEARLAEADLAFSKQNSFDDVLDDPHLADVGLFVEIAHPMAGDIRMIRHPILYRDTPANIRRHAPHLGEHNREVFGATSEDEAFETISTAKG